MAINDASILAQTFNLAAKLNEERRRREEGREERTYKGAMSVWLQKAEAARRSDEQVLGHYLTELGKAGDEERVRQDRLTKLGIFSGKAAKVKDQTPTLARMLADDVQSTGMGLQTIASKKAQFQEKIAVLEAKMGASAVNIDKAKALEARYYEGATSPHAQEIAAAAGEDYMFDTGAGGTPELDLVRQQFLQSGVKSKKALADDPIAWKGAVGAAVKELPERAKTAYYGEAARAAGVSAEADLARANLARAQLKDKDKPRLKEIVDMSVTLGMAGLSKEATAEEHKKAYDRSLEFFDRMSSKWGYTDEDTRKLLQDIYAPQRGPGKPARIAKYRQRRPFEQLGSALGASVSPFAYVWYHTARGMGFDPDVYFYGPADGGRSKEEAEKADWYKDYIQKKNPGKGVPTEDSVLEFMKRNPGLYE